MKCKDPCPGTCGLHARCRVVNHNAICSCNPGFVGDPFVRCLKEEESKTRAMLYLFRRRADLDLNKSESICKTFSGFTLFGLDSFKLNEKKNFVCCMI